MKATMNLFPLNDNKDHHHVTIFHENRVNAFVHAVVNPIY